MIIKKGRILCVDPGEKNIGIAISDENATLARALMVIQHVSLAKDVESITKIAEENQVKRIIVGYVVGEADEMLPQSRHAKKMMEAIGKITEVPVILWDESNSTKTAKELIVELNVRVSKRKGHHDALAAAVILQSYLDEQKFAGDVNE